MKIALRGPNWLGDLVMALPAIEGLAATGAEIHLFVPTAYHELLAGHLGSRVALHPATRGLDREASARLRELRPDAGVLLTHSYSTAATLLLARVPRRIGTARRARGLLLTDSVIEPTETLHQIDEYLWIARRAARALGLDESRVPEAGAAPRLTLGDLGAPPASPRLVLCPGAARGPAKRWLPERYARIAREAMTARREVILLGAQREEETGAAIARDAPGVRDLVGRTTLLEAARTIAGAEGVLSNDSGLAHLAGALDRPLVVLFGPTDPARTAPRATRRAAVKHDVECAPCELRRCPIDHRCMTGLTETRVLTAIEGIVGGWN